MVPVWDSDYEKEADIQEKSELARFVALLYSLPHSATVPLCLGPSREHNFTFPEASSVCSGYSGCESTESRYRDSSSCLGSFQV